MSSIPPIFAFGFATWGMLPWLAAAAAPILIHLWSRRRYRQMDWAAMEYLLSAIRRNRRRLQIEQLLLLLLRTLAIVLVVLAVAEPYFERAGLAFTPGERTHRVIVIDGSYSMAYTPTDKSRFQRAKEVAARIVEESPQGDGFTLVVMSAPPRVVVGNPVFEPRDFLPELDDLALPHTTADLPATLAQVEQVLFTARREHPRLVREEVYFLSDLGRVG
ncbi:MAG: BatA domain-containing protein, partial [Planctomycetota bacterium]